MAYSKVHVTVLINAPSILHTRFKPVANALPYE
jgi:hypothetical protein